MKVSSVALAVVVLSAMASDSAGQRAVSPAASASASARAKVEIPPWPEREGLPSFDAEPFSDDKTKMPKLDEWKAATEVRLSRISPTISSCRAYRLREWMKIHCDTKTAGLRLLAGSIEGVALWVADSLVSIKQFEENSSLWQKHFETMGRYGEIIFPVRRGDRRIFEWLKLEIWESYEGAPGVGSTSSMIVEEQWQEGAKVEIALLAR